MPSRYAYGAPHLIIGTAMLATFRNSLSSWPLRLFFLFLAGLFVVWGIGSDMLQTLTGGDSTAAATVAGRRIDPAEVQSAYQQQLQQVTQMMGDHGQPTADMRRSIVDQVLERLVTQAALTNAAERLHLTVPDDALRTAVYAIPAFRGPSGSFDRATMQSVLSTNGLNEQRFLQLLKTDLLTKQLITAVSAGVTAPDGLSRQIYALQREQRGAVLVTLPFSAVPAPPAPDAATIERWWANHPDLYSSPELRHIKAVVLSPETVAKTVAVSDDELKAAYEQHKAEFIVPEKRSAEVIITHDDALATKLAQQWHGGADWATMQKAASDAGAAATDLDDALPTEFPNADLAKAVFAAAPQTIVGPVATPLGGILLQVTKVTAGSNADFTSMRDDLRTRLAQDKAADLVYQRTNQLQDLLSGGTKLEELPDDLGLAAVSGTLDNQGRTAEGAPAPIPGSDSLRTALIATAFQQTVGEAPHLTEAPDHGYYAVEVDDITKATVRPLAEVHDAVVADLAHDSVRHAQEEKAAGLLGAVKGGKTLADAAKEAGLPSQMVPPIGRGTPPAGVPTALVQPLFNLKLNEATMLESKDGFLVVSVTSIQSPDPNSDPAGFAGIRDALNAAMSNDYQLVYAGAVRARAKPTFNQQVLDHIAQPDTN
jgi:peptidyl-prolyl cis-trans isomerase D